MKNTKLPLLVLGLALAACSADTKNTEPQTNSKAIEPAGPSATEEPDSPTVKPDNPDDGAMIGDFGKNQVRTLSKDSTMRDDQVSITDLSLKGDMLQIDVSYGGGCEPHDFDLSWSGSYMKSNPAKVALDIRHNDHGDRCETLVSQPLYFDISGLKDTSGHLVLMLEAQEPLHYRW